MGEYFGIIITIGLIIAIVVIGIIFTSRRKMTGGLHGKMMDDLLKTQQNMLNNKSGRLEGLMSSVIQTKKKILEENAEDLAYIAQKEAELKSGGVRVTAKAVKDGLTGNDDVFCKYCGAMIDSDSKFCKSCGKEQ